MPQVVSRRKTIGQILREEGVISETQIQEALRMQRDHGGVFGAVLQELGYASEEAVVRALGIQSGMEIIDLDHLEIPPEVIDRVPVSIATIYRIVPVSFENETLTVAMAEPHNVHALDDLRFMLSCEVRGAIAREGAVDAAIEKHYAGKTQSVEDIIGEIDAFTGDAFDVDITRSDGTIDIGSIQEMVNYAPVIKLLNLILLQAIKDTSSDIHFEPFEDEFKVRYRVDGVLYEMVPPPKHLALAITSRIKVMSQLNIAETRLPQDGRIELRIAGRSVDLRISTLPTLFGESVVMRVLDRSVVALDLERIGMREDELKTLRQQIALPHGIILVTGPTGCGKTTTLYSCLNEANDIGVKIITTEDPVEYDLPGIMQVEIKESVGVTFALCLRHILRQDPDKILVGEIRDLETAEIAVRASLTGHIVFSTLHTNDAPSSVTRLLDMGLEPFLIAATLQSVVAQRLVRTICLACKVPYDPTEEMLAQLNMRPADVEGRRFHYGKGCESCNNTGYRGRTAVFEIMMISDRLRELITRQASTAAIREVAIEEGMRTMRGSGLLKIFDGVTTIEEVVRETLLMT
jgi:type IV pilus assembly protein PilB